MGFVEKDEVAEINAAIRTTSRAREERKSRAAEDLHDHLAQIAAEQEATRAELYDEDLDDNAQIRFAPQNPAANARMNAISDGSSRSDGYGKGKGKSARDRMAEIHREAAALKEEAYKANDTNVEDGGPPNLAQLGAACAAAKVAGGIFYTMAENAEMHEK